MEDVEIYVKGRRAYTLNQAARVTGVVPATMRQRLHRAGTTAAGQVNPREPVYYPEDLGIEEGKRLRREDEQSLWINHALAAKLVVDPTNVIERAKVRLQRLRAIHSDGSSNLWFDRWQVALDAGPHAVLEIMTSRSEEATTMRSASPMSGLGLLSDSERTSVRAAFRDYWNSTHRVSA
ncbi:MAG TPA: hypothetical protein VK453_25660 [Micromonosporaceae bacterium]|nr:hypothetical protein [Micromonosporaceae bacterium]